MDFCMELPKGAASKLGEMGVESTMKQFKYMIQYKNIIANLNKERENLDSLRQSLQGWVDAESTKGNEIPRNVLNWLSKEAEIEVALQSFYENKVNKNKKCFWGQCTNFAFNYSLGKQATEKIEDVTRLNEEGKQLPLISYRKAAPALGSTFEDYKSLESRNKIIQVLIEKLKDDKLKRIGICGMGGVGKTTLVKELIKTVENKLFDKVVMAVVSQNPDYEKTQRQIADGLSLKLKGQSMEGRGWEIFQRFKDLEEKKVKVLIVLDDVWKELNFELIGLSSQDHQKCIKILFTSRDEKVCQQNSSQDNVHVSVLLGDEAWSLFREMAGNVVSKPDINPIESEVARECGGLPLAIATVGRALGNEEKSTWEVALQQLRHAQSSSFSNMQECVYSRIELSINILCVEHKACLFLCGLFPEDFDIPIESLLRHGVGLGLFMVDDYVWKARNYINYLVNSLKKCFLLLDSEEPGCVKMHDVVRDVVLKISSREELGILVHFNVELKRVKKKLAKWRRMSLILDEDIELENGLECPTLELLQVLCQRENREVNIWPENFTHGMTKLIVLYIQNVCIPKTLSHFHASVNLRTLQLEGCDVGDISIIGKELNKLEILSFANSSIEELPLEIGNLRFLTLLDLTGCDYLNYISPNVLARLSSLEEFYFRIENFPWLLNREVVKELRNISPQFKVLEIKVRNVEILPCDMVLKNLEFFWVYIGPNASYERLGYLEPNTIQLRALDYNSIKSSVMIMQLFKKCEILILEKVKDLKNVISELDDCGLQCVKDLRLDSCPNLECVIDCNTPLSFFPLISSLSLSNLAEMREIIRAPNHQETTKAILKFSNLEKLELMYLDKMIGFMNSSFLHEHHQPIHNGLSSTTKLTDSTNIEDGETSRSNPDGCRPSSVNAKLFSSNWIKQFPKLEIMELLECNSIEMVFDLEGYSELIGNAQNFLFPQLRKVEISQMHSLLYVWGNVPYHIQGFNNLRFLTISSCNSLKYVFTSVIVRAITNLQELRVSYCEKIENIIVWSRDSKEDDTIKGDVATIGFNKLCYLSLSQLPKLVNICSYSVELEYPSLREFEIDDCPMLEISLSPTYIHANQDSLNNVTHSANKEDDNIEVNSSSSSTCPPAGCTPFLSKFFHKGNTNKRINKEESITQAPEDHIPSNFEMEMKKGKSHMPVLEDLDIVKCDSLDFVFFHKEKFNFAVPSHLKTIKIEKCDKLKIIMARTENREDMINTFTQVVSLHLMDLPNLVKFSICGPYELWNNQKDKDECVDGHESIGCHLLMDESLFPNLTSLHIEACNKISILISHSSLGSLEHLEKLEVLNCENMREIVSLEESSNKIVLHRLKHLILEELPNLKAFCLSSYNFFFPSLQKVQINNCPNMEVFSQGFSATPVLVDVTMNQSSLNTRGNIQKTADINDIVRRFKAFVASQGSKMLSWTMLHNFIKKSEISIKECHELPYLVPYNKVQMLQHVEELTVSYCNSLAEVFESEGGEGTRKGDVNTHYQLQNMTLEHLPKLSHIWKHNIVKVISFQKLTNIEVLYCHSLKSLFSHAIARSLVQLQKLKVQNCDMMEEIVTKEDENTEGGSKVKILFPKLKGLTLDHLPNLESVCSRDYDYDLPLCTIEEDLKFNNSDKVQISFPQLQELVLIVVPKLKCFCSGAYDYNIMMSSIKDCPNMTTFPHGNVIVDTPNLHKLWWEWYDIKTLGDLNLTIYYLQNSQKYQAELQKLETFRDMDEELLGYIKSVADLHIVNCHRRIFIGIPSNMMHLFFCGGRCYYKLSNCIPSNMMQFFSHLESLRVEECECLEEIFESNDSMVEYELSIFILRYLPNLKHIWKSPGQILGFQQLGYIDIKQCNDLKYVFPDVSIATSLPKLWKIDVYECKKIEKIIGNNYNHVETQQQKAKKIIFPKLNQITLGKLPSLKCFSQSSFPCYVEMPKCEWISVKDVPKMKTFWYEGILYTPRLRGIFVENIRFDKDEDVNEVIQQNNK